MKRIIPLALASIALLPGCNLLGSNFATPLRAVEFPSFDLIPNAETRGTTDMGVTVKLNGVSDRSVQYTTSEIEAIAVGLYDSTGAKFPTGGLIKTNATAQTTVTLAPPSYLSDIKSLVGNSSATDTMFMVREATGSAGTLGSSYTASFKYIKDGSYTLFVEAAKKVNGSYVSIGRGKTAVTVSPANRDSGSYTTITIPNLAVTLDADPSVGGSTTISDGTSGSTM